MDGRALLPREPGTHTAGSIWWERICCEDYSLSRDELAAFYALSGEANIMFEKPHERWDLVRELYQQYFGEEPKVSGREFMKLGFQGQSPETDFRGGGVLSLQLILGFVRRNKPLVQRMEHDSGGFFFAITAINIAFFLKKYFHLADFLLPGRDEHIYCSRKALKNFCRVLSTSRGCFAQLHELLLKDFYSLLWLREQGAHPQTLLQFNVLFERLQAMVKEAWANTHLLNWAEFLARWTALTDPLR